MIINSKEDLINYFYQGEKKRLIMALQGGLGESRIGRYTIGENKGKKLRQGRDHIGDKAI